VLRWSIKQALARGSRAACAGALIWLAPVAAAHAVPAFAVQTSQPCAACHVGAFGPQLKPFGRDFKLHGYVGNDGQDHGLPLAMTTRLAFTHTGAPQVGGAAPGLRPTDNTTLETISLYYAGKITTNTGAFIETTFDGVAQKQHLDNVDIRHTGAGEWLARELLWGVTANNGPTVTDPWNSTPVWGFPYNRSSIAPIPAAATLVDGGLAQRAGGLGAYLLWNGLIYAEVDAYKGFDPRALNALGEGEGFQTNNVIPYGRLALLRDWERHHLEVGAYAMTGSVLPGGNQTFGLGTRVTDTALDATYQFIVDPGKVTSDMLSAHGTYIHEDGSIDPNAPAGLFATLHHRLDTLRFDVSLSFAATVTPTVQYFRTSGTTDPGFWNTPNGRPNSEGMIFEVAYVPFGKPDTPFRTLNVRLALQYVDYFAFNGTSVNARDNNNFYLSAWTALKF
jgi:hypothetical protein